MHNCRESRLRLPCPRLDASGIHITTVQRLARTSPPVKLVLWTLFVLGAAAAVWVAGALSGAGLKSFEQRRETVFLVATLVGLMVLMAGEQRPLRAYGLAVPEDWWRRALVGFTIGVAGFAACVLAAGQLGSFRRAPDLGPGRWVGLLWTTPEVLGMALTQQVIFAGYLLAIFRERYGRVLGVTLAAVLFGLLHRIHEPLFMFSAERVPLLIGLVLMGILLALLRLKSGNLVTGIALLAGWLLVERMVSRTRYWPDVSDSGWSLVLGPGADPRQAPLVWLLLSVAIVACALRPDAEEAPSGESEKLLAASFTRLFPVAAMNMMAPIDVWGRLLIRARCAVPPLYWLRLLVTLIVSTINTVLCLPERLLVPLLVRWRVVKDPIFIVGVQRSGTTHLHYLLSLDRRFVTPRTYQVINPSGCLFAGWPLILVLALFFPRRRPVDGMRFGMFTPNEDEFAIANLCGISPHGGVMFPRLARHYDRFMLAEQFSRRELAQWKRCYMLFLRKLVFWGGKRPLLKNPYNTGRIELLRDMFPNAKFIHIHRHPAAVYRSNLRLQREGHCSLEYQNPDPPRVFARSFLHNYLAVEQAFWEQSARLGADQLAHVTFEELEVDPVGQVKRAYEKLGLSFEPDFEMRLHRYLRTVSDYKKNPVHPLPADERTMVQKALRPLFERWGYESAAGG